MFAYINARVFTGEEFLEDHAVLVADDKISAVIPVNTLPEGMPTKDLRGHTLAPAFIDLQIYGGHGQLFSLYPSVAALTATYEYCRSGGTSAFQPTVATESREIMLQAMQAVKAYWEAGGKGVIGLHLEGPFINPEKKGAHLPQYIKSPGVEDIDWILAHGTGIVTMITLAPECCAPELIDRLQAAGIIVSAGHSNATYEEGSAAFNNGITVATHLFNAMSSLQHRAPGLVGALFDHNSASSSVVADGVHVDYSAIRIAKKIMGPRLFLITDAVVANPAGDYVYVEESDRYVNGGGTLAGSKLTMWKAVQNSIHEVGIGAGEALRMASLYPAAVMKQAHLRGRIAEGYLAELVVLDGTHCELL
ncbi:MULTISPECIES: N-acetylglucosamine-6-phosphate deacetylase [Chitinophaga]|uniref:N-acetylglucosamine-6-phosphate deacetylase n=1 Tax=Chitinophaga TaxID=79328 RepID=UPI001CED12F9|nr:MULTISPECIES: N-acetylglucosamine-6-phosphate deacetylase [Chitinophaga]